MTEVTAPETNAASPSAAFAPVELFVADPHGEYEELSHILRTAGGNVQQAVAACFGNALTDAEAQELITCICYPAEKLATMDPNAASTVFVRMGELAAWLKADVPFPKAPDTPFSARAKAIRRACLAHPYMLGDVYDRGPLPDAIMEELAELPDAGLIWGNHDMLWMGAALGQPALVATVVRICARYGNLSILEGNYGMDLSAVRTFAMETYGDDPAKPFFSKPNEELTQEERVAHALVEKTMAVIQFKVEAACAATNPDFDLTRRDLLSRIDWEAGTVEVDGAVHPMLDMHFPTIDPGAPLTLTAGEEAVLAACVEAFTGCAKLQRHMKLFLDKGALYRIVPGQSGADLLLFHACVPLNADGSLKQVTLFGQTLAGRALFDAVDGFVRDAFTAEGEAKRRGQDMLWYLWLGEGSPLFGKSKMATFELYFVEDKATQKEVKNAFYGLVDDERAMGGVLREFGLGEAGRILCGHVPVKVKKGEDPVKCGGRLLMLDGGMSKPYQKTTGVAGFCAVREAGSPTMQLHSYEPFCGREAAIATNEPLRFTTREV